MGKKTNKVKRNQRARAMVMDDERRTIQHNHLIYYGILAGLFLLLILEMFHIV